MLRAPLCTAFACVVATCLAQSAPILTDGRFDDWSPGLASFTDNNAPAGGVDLLNMRVTNDADHLYILLVVGSEIDLLDDLVPQTLRLYIDGDNNASTGTAVQTGYGAELQIKFDTRVVTEYFGTSGTVSWSAIDLVPLPTVTNDSFEIAIARNALPDGVNALFTSNTIKLLWRESDGGDAMPNTGTVFNYTFDNTPVPPYPVVDLARTNTTDVRVCAWNVLGDGITQAALQDEYQRILSALAPDVIGFSECVTSTAAQVKTRLDTWIPIGGSGWYTVKDDYDMVTASRWPVSASWPALSRQFPVLIDLPATYATDLLFNATHLQCCTADATRQQQCDAWVQFASDAKSPGGNVTLPVNTPMVIAGDMNFVGWAQQLNTLITGDILDNATYGPDGAPDWDNTAYAHLTCAQADARTAYTWRSNSSAYPSGRLDHFLFSDAVMSATRAFSLRTGAMSAARLTQYGLLANDNATASDHLPLIADFAVPPAQVRLNAKVFLEGPYDVNNGLMHDSLRVRTLIPSTEPYTALGFTQANGGGGTTTGAVLATSGNNAIVDWVLLELRPGTDSASIAATRCALLQRDGDIVDVDGTSSVAMDAPAGAWFVSVRHRNHLGAMTANSVTLSAVPTTVDFTSASTIVFGTGARKAIGGAHVLWAGNALPDNALRYTGMGNDRDPVLSAIGGVVPTAAITGYRIEDVTMDGTVKYTGAGNDRDPILGNIGGIVPTASRMEQLP